MGRGIRTAKARDRILLAPQASLCLDARRAQSALQQEITRDSAGNLGDRFEGIRTGDGEFGAQRAPRLGIISGTDLDGWMGDGIRITNM